MTQKFNVGDQVRCIKQSEFPEFAVPMDRDLTVTAVSAVGVLSVGTVNGCSASRFVLVRPRQFVLVYPNGVLDAQRFATEAEAAEAGEEAFDEFEVFQLVPVAKYSIETVKTRVPA